MKIHSAILACLLAGLAGRPASAGTETGYISVKQENGVWWFVDGQGKKFFSTGVNCVGGCFGHAEAEPIEAKRKQFIVTTLKNWNFNTAGNWSSPSVYDSMYVADQIYNGVKAWENDMYEEALWTGNIYPHLKDEVKPFLKRKTFIGYFVDNEHKWDDEQVFKFYLGLPASNAGSKKLVDFLRRKYDNDIAKLNHSLGLSVSGFDSVPGTKAPAKFSEAAKKAVLKPWRAATAAYFYGRYVAELRRLDPDHLVLGVRWAGFPDLDLFAAVSPFMDVDSINDYNRYGNLKPTYWEAYKITGKPMIISEWSYSGYPKGGQKSLQFIEVFNQKNRGIGYRKYFLNMARAPFMVGSHWFLWTDYDHDWVIKNGNYFPDENMGLVSADEKTVYTELGEYCKQANAEAPLVHAKSLDWKPKVLPEETTRTVKPFAPKVDGNLADWPAALKIPMAMGECLLPDMKQGGTYYLGMDATSFSLGAFVPDTSMEESGQDWSWQSDNFSLKITAVGGCAGDEEISSYVQIHPIGGGKGKDLPYVFEWFGALPYQVVDGEAVRKAAPGGFTFEARLPAKILKGFPGTPGQQWKVSLAYEDISSVSQTWWEGTISLPRL